MIQIFHLTSLKGLDKIYLVRAFYQELPRCLSNCYRNQIIELQIPLHKRVYIFPINEIAASYCNDYAQNCPRLENKKQPLQNYSKDGNNRKRPVMLQSELSLPASSYWGNIEIRRGRKDLRNARENSLTKYKQMRITAHQSAKFNLSSFSVAGTFVIPGEAVAA